MDDDAVATALEAAIADVGILLVRLERYRAGTGPDATALRRRAFALGDDARRLHHRAGLDAAAGNRLLDATRTLAAELQASVAAVRGSDGYRTAVAAHAAGDLTTLARLLPDIFVGLEPFDGDGPLFHAVSWRRRGRPRPPADLAADVRRLHDHGLPGDGDDLMPGVDPLLPAVALELVRPDDEPLVLRVDAGALPGPALYTSDGGTVLVHTARLRVPFVVGLHAALDADALEEAGGVDWPPYRAAVTEALAEAGLRVDAD